MGAQEELPLGIFATILDYVVADADLTMISEHDSPESASAGLADFHSVSKDSEAAIYRRTKQSWEVF